MKKLYMSTFTLCTISGLCGQEKEAPINFEWSTKVTELVDKICAINIEPIAQSPKSPGTGNGKICFSYDAAGSIAANSMCGNVSKSERSLSAGYSEDELKLIKNNIITYPNPTKASDQYKVSFTWSGPALDKIQSVQVFSSTGVMVYSFTPAKGINTTTFSLQNQLSGSFVAKFVLNTGQVVSKNILKW